MHPVPRILLLVVALALASGSGQGAKKEDDEINVCRDAAGQIVALQVDPCPELPEPEPKPAPVVKKQVPQKKKRPVAKPKPRPRQTSWQIVPRAPHRAPANRPRLGKQTFPTRLTGSDRPGPNFATPARTWQTFLAATESNDRATAAACFTPAAIAELGPAPESFPLEDLRELVGSFTRIENEGSVGPFWSIYGVRATRRPKWILFEETPAGEWKITGM